MVNKMSKGKIYKIDENDSRRTSQKYIYDRDDLITFGISILVYAIVLLLASNLFRGIYETNETLMTAFFGLFIFASLFNSFNARTTRVNILSNIIKNKAFIVVISLVIIIQIYLIYYGGGLFRTIGLNLEEFLVMLLISLTVIPFDFIRKMILKLLNKKREI